MEETKRPTELLYIRIFLAIFGAVILISNIIFWLRVSYFVTLPFQQESSHILVTIENAFAFIFGPLIFGLGSIYLLLKSLSMPDQMNGVITFILNGIVSLSVFVSVLFGLSGRKRWGWILTMSIITINLVLACIEVASRRYLPILISIAIFLVVLYALSRKNIRKYFLEI